MDKMSATETAAFRKEVRETVVLGIGVGLSQLAQVLMGVTDTIMMARFGTDALAAGALVNSMVLLAFLFGMGVLQATAPMMGTALGEKHLSGVGTVMRAGNRVALGLSLGIMAFAALLGPLFALTGQPPEVVRIGERFALWLLPSIPASLVFVVQRIYLTTLGEVKLLSVVSLLGVLVNGAGDYVLMYGKLGFPSMGADGCAVSTSLTSVFMVLSIHFFLGQGREQAGGLYAQTSPAPSRELYRSIFHIGLPIGFVLLSEYLVLAGAGVLMGRHGATALAAFSVCLQWLAVFYMIPVGFSQAATTRIALALGQRDLTKLKQAAWAAVGAAAVYGIGAAVVMILARAWLAQALLLHSGAAEVARQAAGYMRWNASLLLLSSLVVACAGVMRGFRETKTPMLIVFLFYWVGSLGSATVLGAFFGDTGVWAGMVAGFTLTSLGLGSALIQKMKHLPTILDKVSKEDSANLGYG